MEIRNLIPKDRSRLSKQRNIHILIGTSQILSVPYALKSGGNLDQLPGQQGEIISHDGNKWTAYNKLHVNSTGVTVDALQSENPNDPIFQIKNQAGETILQ